MQTRNRLSITELEYQREVAGVNFGNFEGMTKEQRRQVWRLHIDKHFPSLEDCPICQSSAADGHVTFSAFYSLGTHCGGGHSDSISCSHCDLEFKGNYYNGSVTSQWKCNFSMEQSIRNTKMALTKQEMATRKPNAHYLPTKYTEGDKLQGYMQGVPYAEYKAAGAMSKYDIAKFAKKTAFRYFNEEEKPQDRSNIITMALKCLVFNPERFEEKYTLLPEVKDRRSSEYKAASKALGADNVFVGAEAIGIVGMRDAILGNDESREAVEATGLTEVSGFHRNEQTDVLIRTKLDKIAGNEAFIIKPVSSVTDSDISNLIFTASYHLEVAMCLDAHTAITGDELECVKLILVEKTAPFQVAIVYLDDISVMVGRDSYTETLIEYKKTLDTPETVSNNKPSFMTSIPEWAMRDYDDLIV